METPPLAQRLIFVQAVLPSIICVVIIRVGTKTAAPPEAATMRTAATAVGVYRAVTRPRSTYGVCAKVDSRSRHVRSTANGESEVARAEAYAIRIDGIAVGIDGIAIRVDGIAVGIDETAIRIRQAAHAPIASILQAIGMMAGIASIVLKASILAATAAAIPARRVSRILKTSIHI